MPLDAITPDGPSAPPRGTADSFRLLTARLKRRPAPAPEPVPQPEPPGAEVPKAAEPPPAAASPPPPLDPREATAALLDIVWGAVDLPPQERSLAGDTLLLLLPRLAPKDLTMLAERVAAMDQPPPLLVSRLVQDTRPEIGGVILERSVHLEEADMLAASRSGESERLRLIARRRSVPPALCDVIVRSGDLLSQLTLLRNPGAQISFASFLQLSQMAGTHSGLQAPLALRADLPLAVALDLLWRLPPELRRVIIARFLSDSVTLGRILSVGMAAGDPPVRLEAAVPPAEVDAAFGPLFAGRQETTMRRLAALTGLAEATVERIFAEQEGEALVVLLKALGLSRSRFEALLERMRAETGLLNANRPQDEFKADFDALSFAKARVLLLYWDWFIRGLGPYAKADASGLVEATPLA